MEHISIEDFHQVVLEKGEENVNIVDVRTPEKFASGHIKGAINLPLSQLEENLNQLNKEKHYFKATNVTAGMNDYPGETISSN